MTDNLEMKKAVFLDRDGTLIEEVNYLSRVEDLSLFQYTKEALSRLKSGGYLLIVITNQSGIGRDIFDVESMHTIHDELQSRLGGVIDGFYFCPHLPCDGCECRKPDIGMINAARTDFNIEMENSWMIGDKKIDVETGFNAGIRSALVKTGYGAVHSKLLDRMPEIIADDLLGAVEGILTWKAEDSDGL